MKTLSLLSLLSLALVSTVLAQSNVTVTSDPPGATVMIINAGTTRLDVTTFKTPTTIRLPRRPEVFTMRFSLADHETKEASISITDRNPRTLTQKLERLRLARTVPVSSTPAGATILVNGRPFGTTPAEVAIVFERANASAPWPTFTLGLELADHESQQWTASYGDSPAPVSRQLLPLRIERQFEVTGTNAQGQPLPGIISVDGKVVGSTPARVPVAFTREKSSDPFSTSQLQVEVPEIYLPRSETVTVDSPATQSFVLQAITERRVPRLVPGVVNTPTGPTIGWDRSPRIGTFDTRDLETPGRDPRRITNVGRQSTVTQSVNSYSLTPDGQRLIYSVTNQDANGQLSASLFLANADGVGSTTTELTRGVRFIDCFPTMGRLEGETLVVFQSNRGPANAWNISAFRLQESRLVGGIQQLTRDNRLLYHPTFVSEQQPVFFAASETFPEAEPTISYVRPDGSSYTNLGEVGDELHRAVDGSIYFVRRDATAGVLQIYRINELGLEFQSVINDVEFSRANCRSPFLSADGENLLFVSDCHTDVQGRTNENIYLLHLPTGRIQQLTDNGSDDLLPRWSPTESNVVFFLSNRGPETTYNVWRMRLSTM